MCQNFKENNSGSKSLNTLDISLPLALTKHLSKNFDIESGQVLMKVNAKYRDIAMSRTCRPTAATYLRGVVS